jgi:hypothetical protein
MYVGNEITNFYSLAGTSTTLPAGSQHHSE